MAIGRHEAQQLINEAAELGVTPEQLAEFVDGRSTIEAWSRRDAERAREHLRRIRQEAADRQYRQQIIDRVVYLAKFFGHDAELIRTRAADQPTHVLEGMVQDAERQLRSRGIDTRTPEQRQAAARAAAARAAAPATERQVAYLADLLRRGRHHEGGFVSTRGLVENGRPVMAELRRLTRAEASRLIDSLTGQY